MTSAMPPPNAIDLAMLDRLASPVWVRVSPLQYETDRAAFAALLRTTVGVQVVTEGQAAPQQATYRVTTLNVAALVAALQRSSLFPVRQLRIVADMVLVQWQPDRLPPPAPPVPRPRATPYTELPPLREPFVEVGGAPGGRRDGPWVLLGSILLGVLLLGGLGLLLARGWPGGQLRPHAVATVVVQRRPTAVEQRLASVAASVPAVVAPSLVVPPAPTPATAAEPVAAPTPMVIPAASVPTPVVPTTAPPTASPIALPALSAARVVDSLTQQGLPIGAVSNDPADADPDGLADQPGQYRSRAVFADTRLKPVPPPFTLQSGGAVEVFASPAQAGTRLRALARTQAVLLTTAEQDMQQGIVILRLSGTLSPEQVAAYAAALATLLDVSP